MQVNRRRALLLLLSLVITFVVLRSYLHMSPDSDLNIGPYSIHHLFTGLLLIIAGGIPLAICHGNAKALDLAAVAFGVGLSMALDEWVYLITTDGSNSSYLLPISFWGGAVMVGLACLIVVGLCLIDRQKRLDR
jgi:hypothetical protein